jgi:hypothetical protein
LEVLKEVANSPKTKKNTAARQRAQAKYNAKPEQKKRRAMRNKARREMMKAGKVRKGDNKDVHHKDDNPMNTRKENFSVTSEAENRSIPRTKSGTRRG